MTDTLKPTMQQLWESSQLNGASAAWLEPLYADLGATHLSAVNRTFLEAICGDLGIGMTLRVMIAAVPDGVIRRLRVTNQVQPAHVSALCRAAARPGAWQRFPRAPWDR